SGRVARQDPDKQRAARRLFGRDGAADDGILVGALLLPVHGKEGGAATERDDRSDSERDETRGGDRGGSPHSGGRKAGRSVGDEQALRTPTCGGRTSRFAPHERRWPTAPALHCRGC